MEKIEIRADLFYFFFFFFKTDSLVVFKNWVVLFCFLSCRVFQRDLKNNTAERESTGKIPFFSPGRIRRLLAARF